MIQTTLQEREAFLWMQGRMVELLLRHEASRFRSFYDELNSSPDTLLEEQLRPYRNLAVMFYLRDELFNAILPGIKRRLSFEAPRQTRVEALPARGRVDWTRTAAANFRNWPGETPLEVHTRQRRRHFAIPENLLVVVTLLEYRSAALKLLETEKKRNAELWLRHPLNDIYDTSTRELAFLQFAGLVPECQEILAGRATYTTEELEKLIASKLLPGHNSAYSSLLDWRKLFRNLRLLDRENTIPTTLMLGVDPAEDDKLYQYWLFYEIASLLREKGCLLDWNKSDMHLRYTWGTENTVYNLRHDRDLPGEPDFKPMKYKSLPKYWGNKAPGVRPDYYIWLEERQIIKDGSEHIWHEPGYILDAKYYKPRESTRAPSSPVKRMISDLQLTGEKYGALLFAFQTLSGSTQKDDQSTEQELNQPDPTLKKAIYQLNPQSYQAQYIQPDPKISIWRTCPNLSDSAQNVTLVLEALLDTVHETLSKRVKIACHGFFLDTLSSTAHRQLANAASLVQRNGRKLVSDNPEDILVCPKPHIAPWRIDLVSLEHDCCNNGQLCHVKGKPGIKKPKRLTMLEDIKDAISTPGLTVATENDEAVTQAATQQVLLVTKRYTKLLQPNIAFYRKWIRNQLGIGDIFENTKLLTESQRETLALGRFLWEQINHIQATNYAGPALLLTGVLDELTQKTIHRKSRTLFSNQGARLPETLGTISNCKDFGGTNWPILKQAIVDKGFWIETFPNGSTYPFSKFVDDLKELVPIRNKAAHKAQVDSTSFDILIEVFFGTPLRGLGVFNGLLLAWKS